MKHLFSSSFAALLIGLSGCVSAPDSDKERFDLIAKDLEPGGTVFTVNTFRQVQPAFEKFIKETEAQIWSMPLPDHGKFFCQRLLSQFELATRLLGAQELKGWGFSSKQLPGKEVLFRNRGRFLLPPAPKGILWNLPGENLSLEKHFDNLPADTVAAGAFVLKAETLAPFFEADKSLLSPFSDICKHLLQLPVKEVLKNMEGTWRFVVVCDEGNEWETLFGIYGALTVPDWNGKIFAALSSKLKVYSGAQVDLERGVIKFQKMDGGKYTPLICKGKDCFTVYTTPRAVERTSRGGAPLQRAEFLTSSIRQLPPAGAGAFYVRNTALPLNPGEKLSVKETTPVWGVLKREENGFSLECLSRQDFNSYALKTLLSVPVKVMYDIVRTAEEEKARSAASQRASRPQRSAAPRKAAKTAPAPQCASHLELQGKKLLAAVQQTGQWPESGIDGIRRLIAEKKLDPRQLCCPQISSGKRDYTVLSYSNCHYLYFGKPAMGSPKTPVLMELPFLHRDHFSVFYADGSVEKIQLSGQRNVRRAVSFLHTRHTYEEEEFMRLMHLAGEFDKILER